MTSKHIAHRAAASPCIVVMVYEQRALSQRTKDMALSCQNTNKWPLELSPEHEVRENPSVGTPILRQLCKVGILFTL